MNSSFFKKLNEWESNGLISVEQHTRIKEYEKNKKSTSYAMVGFILLGVAAMIIGVISMIAYNWVAIPGWLKLTFDFMLLMLIAMSIYYTGVQKKVLAFEALLFLFAGFILASIGLISQVFHTTGEFYQAVFLWGVVTFPLLMFSQKDLLIHSWIILLLIAVFQFGFTLHIFNDETVFITYLLMIFPFLFTVIVLVGVSFSKFIFLQPLVKASAVWAFISFIAGTIYISVLRGEHDRFFVSANLNPILLYGPTVAVSLLALFHKNLSKRSGILLTITALLYSLFYSSFVFSKDSRLLDAVIFLFAYGTLSVFFLSINYAKIFDLLLAGMGIRFIVIYFQIIGDLATTGIGLFISGLLIILFTVLYFKKRDALSLFIKQFIQMKEKT